MLWSARHYRDSMARNQSGQRWQLIDVHVQFSLGIWFFYCLCLCLVAPPTAAVKAFCVQGDPTCSGGFASSGSTRKELWMEEKIGGKSMTGVNPGINSSINPGLDPGQSILHRSGGSIAVGEINPTIYDQNPAKKIATWNEKMLLSR